MFNIQQVSSRETSRESVFQASANLGGLFEAVLVRSRMRAALRGKSAVEAEDIKGTLEDFIPPSYPTEVELQNVVAVLECASKCLLPQKYCDADRGEMIQRTNELLIMSRQSGEG